MITSSATWKVLAGSKPSTSLVAATSSSPNAAPCALPVPWSLRCRPADDRVQADKARPIRYRPALQCLGQRSDIFLVVMSITMGPVHCLHMPAVRGVAGGGVLGERDLGVVLDGDPVAVVDEGELLSRCVAASDDASEATPSSISPSEARR